MAQLDSKKVKELAKMTSSIEQVPLADGSIAFRGRWIPDTYFDNYTECLYANTNFHRKKQLADKGLNEHGQTPEQIKEVEKRKKESAEKIKQAEILREGIAQVK